MLTKNTDQLRANVLKHVAADSIVQGKYWDAKNKRGCFIGCLAHGNDPVINEQTYGLPVMIQRIAENIFEALPANKAKEFFAALPDAVGCDGKDLSKVGWQFLASELRALPEQSPEIHAVIDPVIAGMDRLAQGLGWAKEDAKARAAEAALAAALAAAEAALAAAWVAAADAALAAAWAAAWVAAAAEALAAAAARAALNARLRQRDTLLQLISQAPVA